VWLLERGREHLPGSFPARFGEVPGDVRFSKHNGKAARGYHEGLFDVRVGDEVNLLLGNGLGGGSLINAGVMHRPDASVFDRGWPDGVTLQDLEPSYRAALDMLEVDRLPAPPVPKLEALRSMAAAVDRHKVGRRAGPPGAVDLCQIAVSFGAQASVAGVPMHPCTRCGDCITGCNQGAKRTLDTNYLAWARQRGAELFCGGWVHSIERGEPGAGWRVLWHYTAPDKRPPGAPPFVVRARCVILAAGSLGSTEILLRSRGLGLSGRLGESFSTNGDQIAATFRQHDAVMASRDEEVPASAAGLDIGPTITGMVSESAYLGERMVVQEFAVPAAWRRLMGEVTTTFGLLQSMFTGECDQRSLKRWARAAAGGKDSGFKGLQGHSADRNAGEDLLGVTTASLEHTSILGMMGDDGAGARIELCEATGEPPSDGMVRITGIDHERLDALSKAQFDWVQTACRDSAVGGTAVPNPSWRVLPPAVDGLAPKQSGVATTVHPLGGCGMGNDFGTGVVNRWGQVFRSGVAPATGVHPGLAVLDGSIVPTALGINPALTIAALAEQAVPVLARDWSFVQASREPPGTPVTGPSDPPALPATPAIAAAASGQRRFPPPSASARAWWAHSGCAPTAPSCAPN
jgi:choline dehydrogenase-like flavoprotein